MVGGATITASLASCRFATLADATTEQPSMSQTALMRTRVAPHRGATMVFVDGEPTNVLGFWHRQDQSKLETDLVNFADAGVHVFSTGAPVGDTADLDARMRQMLARDDHAMFLPRVGLYEGHEWRKAKPDEVMIHRDLAGRVTSPSGHRRAAFTSTLWRRQKGEELEQFVRHAERHWSRHILGYHLAAGATGEWSYAWGPMMSDFSAPQHAAFRAWLRQRYGDDVETLRRAWGDDAVSFDTAEVPADCRADSGNTPMIFNPGGDQRQIAINHFAGIVKRTLRELGTDKIVGVFYGYHLLSSVAFHSSGHHALRQVLASPDVDFICSPQTYHLRHPGGMFESKLPLGSLRLHGKLYYNEDDTFTHLAKKTPWRYCCPDAQTTVKILRRNFVGMWTGGGQQWWMDHDGDGWYRDETLMAEVEAQRKLADELLQSDRTPAAQVAVIISEQSAPLIRRDDRLIDGLLTEQVEELAAIGAPYETFDASDLGRLFGSPEGDRFRFVVFLDAIYLTPEQRQVIRERVARDGRVVLWVWAAGLADEQRNTARTMSELIGIDVGFPETPRPTHPPTVEAYLNGARHTYGSRGAIPPVLVGEDDDAETLGWLQLPYGPGLMRKWQGEGDRRWCSIWSAAPGVPATILQQFAADAGVHLYADTGDQVFANASLLALHARSDGPRTIRLPRPAKVVDAFTRVPVADAAEAFDVTLQRGDTAAWRCTWT